MEAEPGQNPVGISPNCPPRLPVVRRWIAGLSVFLSCLCFFRPLVFPNPLTTPSTLIRNDLVQSQSISRVHYLGLKTWIYRVVPSRINLFLSKKS